MHCLQAIIFHLPPSMYLNQTSPEIFFSLHPIPLEFLPPQKFVRHSASCVFRKHLQVPKWPHAVLYWRDGQTNWKKKLSSFIVFNIESNSENGKTDTIMSLTDSINVHVWSPPSSRPILRHSDVCSCFKCYPPV